MKILYVCHRFPYPPKRGGKIRPFNMIRHLSLQHDVTVCSLARSPQEAEEARGIAAYCKRFEIGVVDGWIQALRMVARLPTPFPSSFGYFRSTSLARTIDRLLATEKFDLICFISAESPDLAIFHQSAKNFPAIFLRPAVNDPHHQGFVNFILYLENRIINRVIAHIQGGFIYSG